MAMFLFHVCSANILSQSAFEQMEKLLYKSIYIIIFVIIINTCAEMHAHSIYCKHHFNYMGQQPIHIEIEKPHYLLQLHV